MSPDPSDSSSTDLPVLTQMVGAPAPEDLPTLTEVVDPPPPVAHSLSEEEIQQLLKLLESRMEVVFTQKLSQHLEKLQRLAVRQAVNEFRAAMPDLLHEILNTPPKSPP